MPQIKVPAALTGGSSSDVVEVEGTSVGEALDAHADAQGPELRDSVIEDGEIREYINVFVDGEPIEQEIDTPVGPDDVIRIVPAASGG
ncbi:MAG: MoaD/ThiS family protein [Halobacteriales archaeon]